MNETCRKAVLELSQVSKRRVASRLRREAQERRHLASDSLCTSLLNLLYNIVIVGSVPVNQAQRQALEQYTSTIWNILSKRTSLTAKCQLLIANPDLVIAIASTCLDAGS